MTKWSCKKVLKTPLLPRNADQKHGGARKGAGRPKKLNDRARIEIGRLCEDLYEKAKGQARKYAVADWKSRLSEVPAIWTELQESHRTELRVRGFEKFQKMNPKWSETVEVSGLYQRALIRTHAPNRACRWT